MGNERREERRECGRREDDEKTWDMCSFEMLKCSVDDGEREGNRERTQREDTEKCLDLRVSCVLCVRNCA